MFALVLAGSTVLVIGLFVAVGWNDRILQNNAARMAAQFLEDQKSLVDSQVPEKPEVTPLVVAKPAAEWKKTCKNLAAGYQVRYPDEWSAVTAGNGIGKSQVVEDCNMPKFPERRFNVVLFTQYRPESLSNDKTSGIRISAISKKRAEEDNSWITFSPEKPYQGFSSPPNGRKLKEAAIDGETMVWVEGEGDRIFQHGDTQYHVSVGDDVSEELATEFLSTFKFLK